MKSIFLNVIMVLSSIFAHAAPQCVEALKNSACSKSFDRFKDPSVLAELKNQGIHYKMSADKKILTVSHPKSNNNFLVIAGKDTYQCSTGMGFLAKHYLKDRPGLEIGKFIAQYANKLRHGPSNIQIPVPDISALGALNPAELFNPEISISDTGLHDLAIFLQKQAEKVAPSGNGSSGKIFRSYIEVDNKKYEIKHRFVRPATSNSKLSQLHIETAFERVRQIPKSGKNLTPCEKVQMDSSSPAMVSLANNLGNIIREMRIDDPAINCTQAAEACSEFPSILTAINGERKSFFNGYGLF